MNKIKGFIDPVSLGFLVALGIGGVGITTGKDAVDEGQMAQSSQGQTEITAPAKEEPKT